MPCRDYYDDHPEEYYGPKLANKDKEIDRLKKQVAFAESALCAVLRAGEDICKEQGYHFFTKIRFEEAGITPTQLADWFRKHQQLDELHREAEQKKAQKALARVEAKRRLTELKESALAKLSDEEKAALNLQPKK